ncbi:hypothetical protein BDDG_13561 [Blastomyces dermatitidis ATCC 18188]|uniref:Uncharacterized protein n=1 Tax=Ajellomyces dermatitidis (strain ATCC 18188 / CBS 674.68) TaxID=653446 RepID=A0A0J9ETP6_AJEDA|nr:hypothetical protein BDDG_13561 [Blastomyces dermatitidis ATCC 18188]
MAAERAGDELNADALADRRDNTSLHSTATITTVIRDAEGEGDVTMRAVLPWLIDIIFTF